MIKGLYAAASAMMAGVYQQSLIAHNVSNLDTPGFKQVLTSLSDFENVPVSQPHPELSTDNRTNLIGTLGLGVNNTGETTDFSEGSLVNTNQLLDFAIQGPGFFRVETADGERFTRDGRFSRDAEGNLVTVDGNHVLDDSGQPIVITSDAEVGVSGDGTLYQEGATIGRLGIASFSDPNTQLVRAEPNLFSSEEEPDGEEVGAVVQGYVEGSNTNQADLMTRMVQVARQYEAAQRLVQAEDELLGKSIQSLGSF